MAGEWRGDDWGWLNPSSMFVALTVRIVVPASSPIISPGEGDDGISSVSEVSYAYPPRDSGSRAGKGKAPHSTVCLQWNQGECVYPYCKFRHVCMRCGGDHRTGSEMLDGRGRYIYMYMYMEHLLQFNRRVPFETSALPDGISMICRVLIAWFRLGLKTVS